NLNIVIKRKKQMISEITRKNINYSALSLVLIVLLSMFISFFQAANMSTIVNLMVKVLIPLLIIWLSYSLYTFAKEENNKEMNIVSILIFVGAILGQSSILFITLSVFYLVLKS
ncbi:MAG: hypothetical protein ACTSSG_09735, partial [Candidatus Heimdallarchaeaceae archaeon]